jgi:hypothetical protein
MSLDSSVDFMCMREVLLRGEHFKCRKKMEEFLKTKTKNTSVTHNM